jgi:hypothetical protein
LLVTALVDLLICFKSHFTGGSIPPVKYSYMTLYHNAKMTVGRFLVCSHRIMFCWAARAILLTPGVGCAYPQPFAHSLP